MIHTGDSIQNPVTGETVTFRQTAQDTGGERVVADVTLERGGFVAAPHIHPRQTETFRIVDGEVGFRVGGRRFVATAGQTLVVTPGTPHTFWNAGDEPARFQCEVRPALGFARLLETMFALAREGKTNNRGLPHPLRLAAIADHHRDDVRLPLVPAGVQHVAATVGAAVAWAVAGLGPTYDGPPSADRRIA
jgi:mannose-6-phosphate isomerase-like protein (cupin superfamily)